MEDVWTEKYRPKILDDIYGQIFIKDRLKFFVSKGNIPHCIFSGPAGVGKSTCALALARDIFGETWQSNFLELNGSDERGIETIRVKVKDFARTRSLDGKFKIIFLDEADALTRDAQHALRRIMEKYSRTARFIFSCNYLNRIISPIQSRTAVFRFKIINDDEIVSKLQTIVKAETIKTDEKSLDIIAKLSNGDLRKAVNILQTAGENISKESIYNAAGSVEPEYVKKMVTTALAGDFNKARTDLNKILMDYGI